MKSCLAPFFQVSWQLYRIWYENERVHESLDYQTPQALAERASQC